MARSKRAIRDNSLLFLISTIFCAAGLSLLPLWLWQKAVFLAHEKGPAIVEKRLSHLLEKEVRVQGITLSFPSQVSLEGISISSSHETELQVKATRLDVKFSLLSLLSGQIKPKEIILFSPDIRLLQTANSSLLPSRVKTFEAMTSRGTKVSNGKWPASMKPSSWPIVIDPHHIKIIEGQLHLEDESDTMPQLAGQFSLDITRSTSKENMAIQSGHLSLQEASFFYHGLTGKLSGTIEFSREHIETLFHCQPSGGGTLDIQSKISMNKDAPKCSFEIQAHDYGLNNLALLKFPFTDMLPNTTVSGNFSTDSSLLYGKEFPSLSAGVSYTDGSWQIKAIHLMLAKSQGEITGSIVSDGAAGSSLAKANFTYTGNIPPTIQTYEEELIQLNPNLWEKPVTLTSELTIDLASYPLQVTTIKLMGNNGDIFANGSLDLFSGFVTMQGTYLKPLHAGKHTSKDIQNNAIGISLSGPITHPVLRVSPSTK